MSRKGIALGVVLTMVGMTASVVVFFFLFVNGELKALDDKKADKSVVEENRCLLKEIGKDISQIQQDIAVMKAILIKEEKMGMKK